MTDRSRSKKEKAINKLLKVIIFQVMIICLHSSLYSQDNADISKLLNNISNNCNDNRNISLGLMIGEPIGINIKTWTNKSIDLQSAIKYREFFLKSWLQSNSAWIPIKKAWVASIAYPIFPDGYLHMHLDHIWQKYIYSIDDIGLISTYYGCGGRVRFADDNMYGIRWVLGYDVYSEELPLDFRGNCAHFKRVS